MADDKPTGTPSDEQKKSLKAIIKEAVAELADEREEKRRTDGKPVDDGKGDDGKNQPKSFFEQLFAGFGS